MLLVKEEFEPLATEIYYLQPETYVTNARELMLKVSLLNRQDLDLDELITHYKKLDDFITDFQKNMRGGHHILADLKSYRLAFACRIEFLQPKPTTA